MSQRFCRGCAGTGISAKASPREVQAAMLTIYMHKPIEGPEPKVHSRSNAPRSRETEMAMVGPYRDKSRLAMSGPLANVIEHVNKRLADGWEIAPGCLAPDPSLVCAWCDGFGVAGKVLTVHAMADTIELGGNA